MANCVICEKEIPVKTYRGARPGRLCGQKECKVELSRRTIRNSFEKHGGEITKFRKTNGMHNPAVREIVSTKLRAMKWMPPVRKGNGTGPTIHQLAIASALGWQMEVAIPTKRKSSERLYPTCYKVDVGNSELKVAIEVDGNSHLTLKRKAQDEKKDAFLRSIGWTVLRFTNKQVAGHLEDCVQTVLSTISKLKTETPTLQTDT